MHSFLAKMCNYIYTFEKIHKPDKFFNMAIFGKKPVKTTVNTQIEEAEKKDIKFPSQNSTTPPPPITEEQNTTFQGFTAEAPTNYEQKCVCALVLDVSGSMYGFPIDALNKGLKDFHSDILGDVVTKNRLEVAVVTFSSTIEVLIQPSLAENFKMPLLIPQGQTKLVDGLRKGIEVVENRKNWYKDTGQPYYRPWIILMTDGEPDNGQDIEGIKHQIKEGVDAKKFNFFAIGVQGADMNTLKNISHPSMPPAMLAGLKFSEFFRWLSTSMTKITNSKDGEKVEFAMPTWMKGFDGIM